MVDPNMSALKSPTFLRSSSWNMGSPEKKTTTDGSTLKYNVAAMGYPNVGTSSYQLS
jgi:hypothetical protein